MINKIFYLSILIISFLSCKTDGKLKNETLVKVKSDKIDSLANRYLELNRFGGTIMVIYNDHIIYNNSFGLADYINNYSFSNMSTFKIGEISELVTSNIIQRMAKEGNFQLSDSISKYLPEIKSEFSLNDLLNHKTNLPRLQTIQELNPELEYSTVDYVNLAIQSSERSERSDLNYNILGLLIEKISGKSFQENIQDYSKSLALENTYFQKEDSTLAVGYELRNYNRHGLQLQESPSYNPKVAFSSKGLKSTANDVAKILNANSSNKIKYDGYLEDDGFSYSIVNYPKQKIAVIVLSNRRHPVGEEISNSIVAILTDNEYTLPLVRKQIEIDKKLIKEYSGFYFLNDQITLEFRDENDSLFFIMDSIKVYLVPQSKNQFYMENSDASIRFLRNTNNLINEVELLNGYIEGHKVKRVEK